MDNLILDLGLEKPNYKKKILVVDDEPALQSLIADTLDDEYKVVLAGNGREGVKMASVGRPDLILMDLMMPDVGGYQAVKLLIDNPVTCDIPVVVITSSDLNPTDIHLLKTEPNVKGFINKPFKPKTLRDLIKSILEKNK